MKNTDVEIRNALIVRSLLKKNAKLIKVSKKVIIIGDSIDALLRHVDILLSKKYLLSGAITINEPNNPNSLAYATLLIPHQTHS